MRLDEGLNVVLWRMQEAGFPVREDSHDALKTALEFVLESARARSHQERLRADRQRYKRTELQRQVCDQAKQLRALASKLEAGDVEAASLPDLLRAHAGKP